MSTWLSLEITTGSYTAVSPHNGVVTMCLLVQDGYMGGEVVEGLRMIVAGVSLHQTLAKDPRNREASWYIRNDSITRLLRLHISPSYNGMLEFPNISVPNARQAVRCPV